MMGTFSKYLLRGALTILPLTLTIYLLYHFFIWTDKIARSLFKLWIPAYDYIPGSGLIIGIAALFLLGVLMSSRLMQRLYQLVEIPLRNIPLVKSLYIAIKELADYLSPKDERQASDVVLVRIPGYEADVVGFIMRNDMSDMPAEIEKTNRSAVYIPMSYQVGGFTLFLPNDWLQPIDLPVDEAMKNTLTGWISREDQGTS